MISVYPATSGKLAGYSVLSGLAQDTEGLAICGIDNNERIPAVML
jgi:hypothetical protein